MIYNQIVTWTAFAILAMFENKNMIMRHNDGRGGALAKVVEKYLTWPGRRHYP